MAECRNCVLLSLIILSFSAVLARKLDFLGETFKNNVNAIKNHTQVSLLFYVISKINIFVLVYTTKSYTSVGFFMNEMTKFVIYWFSNGSYLISI